MERWERPARQGGGGHPSRRPGESVRAAYPVGREHAPAVDRAAFGQLERDAVPRVAEERDPLPEQDRMDVRSHLVDEVGLNAHPVLLGSGVPLFRDAGRRIPLELLESRVIDGGCVLARYRVRRAS